MGTQSSFPNSSRQRHRLSRTVGIAAFPIVAIAIIVAGATATLGSGTVQAVNDHSGGDAFTVAWGDRTPGASVALMNVTSVNYGAGGSYVSINAANPAASSTVNNAPNTARANSTFVADTGSLSAKVGGRANTSARIAVDLIGEFSLPGSALEILPNPKRVLNSRQYRDSINAGEIVPIALGAERAGQYAIVTLTVANPFGAGDTAVYPCADGYQGTSNLNSPSAGQTKAVTAVVRADVDGRICVLQRVTAVGGVVVDLTGYFKGTKMGEFKRVVDTRESQTQLGPNKTAKVQVADKGKARLMMVSATAVGSSADTFLHVHSVGASNAGRSSTVNKRQNENANSNFTIVSTDNNGEIAVTAGPGATNFIIDAAPVLAFDPAIVGPTMNTTAGASVPTASADPVAFFTSGKARRIYDSNDLPPDPVDTKPDICVSVDSNGNVSTECP